MSIKILPPFLFLTLVLLAGSAMALDAAGIRAKLLASGLDIPTEQIAPSSLAGYFEVHIGGGRIIYVNATGDYLFSGDLYLLQPDGLLDVRNQSRRAALQELDESQLVVFSPPPARVKATITVFTDIDCTYCRKLHQEIVTLNQLGIAVRYLAYPRAGYGSDSWDKAVAVWCAADPRAAMTAAKAGQELGSLRCANHPVAEHYALGARFGVTGTPAIIHEDGRLQAGYLPAQEMARLLGIAVDPEKAGSE